MTRLGTSLAAGLALAASMNLAHANPISLSGSLVIYNALTPGATSSSATQAGSALNPIAQPIGSTTYAVAAGTYSGPINFLDPAGGTDTIAGFLATDAGFTFSPGATQNGGLSNTLSQGNFAQVSLFDFTFTLTSAISGSILHDDGISIWNAANTSDLIDASSPTTPTPTAVNLGPGTYNLWYAEANGLPADLVFNVPEPASLALLGAGLFGLGIARRRRGNQS